jgi:hypothetical protein
VRAANYHLTWEWRPVSLYRRDSVQLIQKKKSPASGPYSLLKTRGDCRKAGKYRRITLLTYVASALAFQIHVAKSARSREALRTDRR